MAPAGCGTHFAKTKFSIVWSRLVNLPTPLGALGPQGSQGAGFRAAGAVGPEGEAVPHLVKPTGTADGACGVWEQPQPSERGPQGRPRGQARAPHSWGVTLPCLPPPRGGKCWARGCVGRQGGPAWAQALLLFTSGQEWAFGDARGGPSTGTWLHEDGSTESSGKAPNSEQERGSRACGGRPQGGGRGCVS